MLTKINWPQKYLPPPKKPSHNNSFPKQFYTSIIIFSLTFPELLSKIPNSMPIRDIVD